MMMRRSARFLSLLGMISVSTALALGTAGCPKKPIKPTPTPIPTETPAPTPGPDDGGVGGDGTGGPDGGMDPSLAGCDMKPIPFDLDSASLSPAATEAAKTVVACLTKNRTWTVSIEGHADERGSTQYNIALGERRARAVADYLLNAGVEKNRVATVSFGEEKPSNQGHDEAAWSANRRVEFKVRK